MALRALHSGKTEVRFRSTTVKFVHGRYMHEETKNSARMYAP